MTNTDLIGYAAATLHHRVAFVPQAIKALASAYTFAVLGDVHNFHIGIGLWEVTGWPSTIGR